MRLLGLILLVLSIVCSVLTNAQENITGLSYMEEEFNKASGLSEDNPEKAIPILLELKETTAESGDTLTLAQVYGMLGNCHYYLNDDERAMGYWKTALAIGKEVDDETFVAGMYTNLANGFSEIDPDSSIYYYHRSYQEYLNLGLREHTFDMLGNLSFAYYDDMKQYDSAYHYAKAALLVSTEFNDSIGLASMNSQLGRVFIDLEQPDSAVYHAKQGLKLSRALGSKRLEELALDAMRSSLYANGQIEQAYAYFDTLMVFLDELNEVERLALVTEMEAQHEVQMKEKEIEALEEQKADVDRENTRQRAVIVSSILGLIMLMFLGFSTIKEKKRSDELLLNILPISVAEELKKTGKATAQRYESVTVLFTDFVDFSKVSEQVSAEVLVQIIDEYFSAFDKIISTYGLEKVKTIGDSYMAAGGIPEPTTEHAAQVVQAALEMQQHVAALKRRKSKEGNPYFDTRIGVHTGPVVAGVVGIKKFAYDIWGDTVNITARLEKASEAGKVNISEKTYELVRDRFNCTHRGKIPIKNLGEIDMYFVG